ncbi:YjgN family protein [Solimicrobium silvestre]|uniref:Putative membrane protein n=1 Tax=Solimicrobium silvestre TaxID=2099400 RepID=A0A2S9H4F3_9BURK|nr:YjgN family protein [Solimicrobium silvestre]PRC94859.1 putative membrane protein [Solimicrobium silvestre]
MTLADDVLAPEVTEHHQDSPQKFSFTATGSEYFRIWIVNLLLSIVTLGIYSAWAKVRRNRYFYSNTHLAEGSFDYHGNAIAILKGRIAAFAIFALYNLSLKTSPTYFLIMLVVMAAILPWLLWKSLQFRLYNSSYRGLRFGFRGSAKQAYKYFLALPILSLFTLYLLVPFTHQRIKKFQHNESRFGSTHFSFNAKVGDFYLTYLIGFVLSAAGMVVITSLFGAGFMALVKQPQHGGINPALMSSIFFFIFAVYAWIFIIYPIFLTMIQNLIWNSTKLGEHQFKSDLKWGKMTFIILTNILGVICTLGLFAPFAHVRYMKYKIESMTLIPNGSIDNFITATEEQISATGDGVADMLDFDLSL